MELLLPRTGIRIGCWATWTKHPAPHHPPVEPSDLPLPRSLIERRLTTRRGLFISTATAALFLLSDSSSSYAGEFFEVPGSGGVKALDLRTGTGSIPVDGDQYITMEDWQQNKDGDSTQPTITRTDPESRSPSFSFLDLAKVLQVISGIEAAVRSMKIGGIRRVIIPPSQGYQSTSQEPIPPNFFDRQRLFTTIFNPKRIANGEGSTLGTLIFDIELVSLRH